MDCIYLVRHVSIAITLTLSSFPPIVSAPQFQSLPGRVVEWPTNRPLGVMVKAWSESSQSAQEGDCPLFGKFPLDSTQSKSTDGTFQLKVDPKNRTYTVTYCAYGYYPRADRDLPSETPYVVPRPVKMHPLTPGKRLDANFIKAETVSALNTLAYLRSINSDQFDKVVNELPRTERLAAAVSEWGKR